MAGIRPFSGEPFGLFPWGAVGYASLNIGDKRDADITLVFNTNHSIDVTIYTRYNVYNRYNGSETNIEDMYSGATYRALALGSLDGPIFSYSSKGNDGV